jgi:hypothetical protein
MTLSAIYELKLHRALFNSGLHIPKTPENLAAFCESCQAAQGIPIAARDGKARENAI